REAIHSQVTIILARRDGSLWVATKQNEIFRIGKDSSVTRMPIDPSLTPDNISRMFEDSRGTLWLASERGLWSVGDRGTEVRAAGRSLNAAVIVETKATHAVYVQTANGAYRVDEKGAVPTGGGAPFSSLTLAIWSDGESLWTLDGRDVYREHKRVFTIPN